MMPATFLLPWPWTASPASAITASVNRVRLNTTRFQKPFDEFVDAVFNLSLWIVVEQPPRLHDVGERLRDIAWLHRLSIDLRFFAQRVFQQGNQFSQLDGARLAQIYDLVFA